MRGPPNGKRLLGHSLLDLALILAALRQTNNLDFSSNFGQEGAAYQHESFYDEGPLLGIVSPSTHHFQHQPLWEGPALSQKSVDRYYGNGIDDNDNIVEEYDNIMRDVLSRPPVIANSSPASQIRRDADHIARNRSVVTMVLSLPNEAANAFRSDGAVQVSRNFNFQSEGAVGGIGSGLPNSPDENFDLFNSYIPENMRDDDIDNLILSTINDNSGNMVTNQSQLDVRWQQYLSEFDNFYPGHKSLNSSFGNWGNFDILNEAMQNAELFLPFVPNSQNSSELELASSDSSMSIEDSADPVTSARLELIETSEWGSQNHVDDLLFPSLPPPSYDEVMASDQTNSSAQNQVQMEQTNPHMHDHTYFNSSSPSSRVPETQLAEYTVRSRQEVSTRVISRHEVSTRVISVPPRPRHTSGESSRSATSEISEASEVIISDTPEVAARSSVRRITTSSESSVEETQNDLMSEPDYSSFEIRQVSSTSYFQNLTKDVGLHREVVLCN